MAEADKHIRKKYAELLSDMYNIVMRPGEIVSINTRAKWVNKFNKQKSNQCQEG